MTLAPKLTVKNILSYAVFYLEYVRKWRNNYSESVRQKFSTDIDLVYYEAVHRGWDTSDAFSIAREAEKIATNESL